MMPVACSATEVDVDALAANSPEFRIARTWAHDNGLTRVTGLKWVSARGLTLRVTFRAPSHRKGDMEVVWTLRARAKAQARRGKRRRA